MTSATCRTRTASPGRLSPPGGLKTAWRRKVSGLAGRPDMPRFKARKAEDDMDVASRVLELAQQTADVAVADAKREAEEILARARQEAEKIIAEAKARAEHP